MVKGVGDSEATDGCLCQRESSIPTADVLNSTFFSLAVAGVRERGRRGEYIHMNACIYVKMVM